MANKEELNFSEDVLENLTLIDMIRFCESKELPILLSVAKRAEKNFKLKEAYLRGYRDGVKALKTTPKDKLKDLSDEDLNKLKDIAYSCSCDAFPPKKPKN